MRAVVADLSTPRYLWTAAAQKLPAGRGSSAGWGRGGLLRLVEDAPEPRLPKAPGWLRLRPELAGICGSDMAVAHAKSSFVLSAYYRAQRQIPGHEIVAVVTDVGPGVSRFAAGDRVAIDPVLSCRHRGFEPVCRSCAEGYPYVCERFDEPGLTGCASPTLGFDAALGGGWGRCWSHTSPSCIRWRRFRPGEPCSPNLRPSACTPHCSGSGGGIGWW